MAKELLFAEVIRALQGLKTREWKRKVVEKSGIMTFLPVNATIPIMLDNCGFNKYVSWTSHYNETSIVHNYQIQHDKIPALIGSSCFAGYHTNRRPVPWTWQHKGSWSARYSTYRLPGPWTNFIFMFMNITGHGLIIMHNWCFIVMTCPRDILMNPQWSNIMGIVALTIT